MEKNERNNNDNKDEEKDVIKKKEKSSKRDHNHKHKSKKKKHLKREQQTPTENNNNNCNIENKNNNVYNNNNNEENTNKIKIQIRKEKMNIFEDKMIKLNIGGYMFQTTKSTLIKVPNTYFSAMLSERMTTTLDENGYYFIDRDGQFFNPILTFLRTFSLSIPPHMTLQDLKREALFYIIQPLLQLIEEEENQLLPPSWNGFSSSYPMELQNNLINSHSPLSNTLNNYTSQLKLSTSSPSISPRISPRNTSLNNKNNNNNNNNEDVYNITIPSSRKPFTSININQIIKKKSLEQTFGDDTDDPTTIYVIDYLIEYEETFNDLLKNLRNSQGALQVLVHVCHGLHEPRLESLKVWKGRQIYSNPIGVSLGLECKASPRAVEVMANYFQEKGFSGKVWHNQSIHCNQCSTNSTNVLLCWNIHPRTIDDFETCCKQVTDYRFGQNIF
eukprot:TRINITY_DN6323_c1_g7_i1.p1 TRINITY_DN6323_c1_g7~~TRINITY_DN6323_c1_g7_i1.p1  ORF type:complete len:444 (+),score=112.87 TRINITY_DN6323_c1_g7_i1:216-1547(+)